MNRRLAIYPGMALAALVMGTPLAASGQLTLVGPSQRISFQGVDGDLTVDAANPAVAYAAGSNEFLTVWSGGLSSGELEIFGQRVGGGGALAAANFKISTQGPEGNPAFNARDPAISFNPAANEYLAVWEGDFAAGENEIFGQRLSVAGALLGGNFKISSQGPVGNAAFDAFDATVAYNSVANEYLVAWEGDATDNEFEVFGQRVAASGALLGGNFQVSTQGPAGDAAFDAVNPVVAYSPLDNQYLVAWQGDRIAGEVEIFGQRVASGGALAGANFRISAQGPDGDPLYDAENATIAYNSADNEFLLGWQGDRVPNEKEIYARRVDSSGSPLGTDARLSFQGVDGDVNIDALDPAVQFNAAHHEYLATWSGDVGGGEFEIQGLRVSPLGTPIDGAQKLTNQGPAGNPLYRAQDTTIGYNSMSGDDLVLWKGDLDGPAGVAGELEVFGQLLRSPSVIATADFDENGVVDGVDLTRWTAGFGIAASAAHTQGDANGDGLVDGSDFLTWQRQLAPPAPRASAAAVPEPGAGAILGLCFAVELLLSVRREA